MSLYDPLAAQFDNRPLAPWQLSKKTFHFDEGFVKWIQKYLEIRKLPCDAAAAKSWIKNFKFEQKRYEDCELQWDEYQESLKAPERPTIKPVVGDCGVSGGDLHGANQSGSDCAVDEVDDPNLPDHLKRREGETRADQNVRIREFVKSKLPKMAET